MNDHNAPTKTPRTTIGRRAALLALGLAAAFASGAPATAAASETPVIAYVKTVEGTALVHRGNETKPLSPGTALYQGDRIETGEESTLGFTLMDGTRLAAGPNSKMMLDKFQFAQQEGTFEFVARVWSGTVEYFSGLLAKVSPGSTTFITPTGEITPKGTHFVIKVDDAPWPDEFAPAADRGAGA